ncbi:MAG: oligoendopeptidase F [Clostridiales bacterium]|nr:oligoendopeptidase F [Clostridiales bacterium]
MRKNAIPEVQIMPELKSRSEMDPAYQWKLEHMFPSNELMEQQLEEVQQAIKELAKLEGHVKDDTRKAIIDFYAVEQKLSKIYVYCSMRKDEDVSDTYYQNMYAKAGTVSVSFSTAASFLVPELLEMSDEELDSLIRDPAMKDYDAELRAVIRQKPHTLPGEQEKLLSMAGDILSDPSDTFSILDNMELPMPETLNEEGGRDKLTPATYGIKLRSRSREVRKEAFEGMLGAFERFGSTIASLYSSAVRGDLFMTRARRFSSCLESALYPDEIPVAVYENLLTAVEGAIPALTEYLNIRKKRLGVDELHMYDLYVPMVDDFDMKLSFDEAFQLVLKALQPLGEDYISVLKNACAEGWADVYENKNKRSGAYSWGCYDTHPFVLLNHTDDLNGAMTLVHELGHAMHSHYSNTTQPYPKAGYSLFVAEVASTCNEVLMMRYLMNEYKDDRKATAFLCNQMLEEFRTTVFRQTLFADFEKVAHEMAEQQIPLTKEELSRRYIDINRKYYGGGCVVDEAIASEWMRIPHFYRNFYVYKYATGFSAAVAIADRILKEGESAVKDYKRFLSAGCSVPPLEALRYAGVDMEKKETVENALKVFADTVKQLGECFA